MRVEKTLIYKLSLLNSHLLLTLVQLLFSFDEEMRVKKILIQTLSLAISHETIKLIQVEFESVSDVACLENENLVKYAITRALHLQEIFNLVAQKYDKKNLNVVEFPYYWVKGYSFLLR